MSVEQRIPAVLFTPPAVKEAGRLYFWVELGTNFWFLHPHSQDEFVISLFTFLGGISAQIVLEKLSSDNSKKKKINENFREDYVRVSPVRSS